MLDPLNSMELIFRASDGVQESSDITWLSHKQYRFAISAYSKSGINRVSAPQLVDFAASTQEELSAWKMFFANLRVRMEPSTLSLCTSPKLISCSAVAERVKSGGQPV